MGTLLVEHKDLVGNGRVMCCCASNGAWEMCPGCVGNFYTKEAAVMELGCWKECWKQRLPNYLVYSQ